MISSLNGINNAFKSFDTAAANIASFGLKQNQSDQDNGAPLSQRPVIQTQGSNGQWINDQSKASDNSLTYNLVQLNQSEIAVKANIKVIQTEKNTLGSILDIKA